MKKIICLLICLMLIPTVNAASATTKISGSNSITVGKTTTIYVKLNASNKIEGVDVTYQTSGNIKVTNVKIGNGLTKMGQNNNRYILYAMEPINSGSTILAITVKGTSVGTGTVKVSNLEATVDSTTVNGGVATYNITVNKAVQTDNSKPADDNSKPTDDKDDTLEKATLLVEAAEKSLLDVDYEKALEAVNSLSKNKEALLKRLQDVKIKIEVQKEANKCNITCEEPVVSSDSSKWIILSVTLFILLIIESVYLIYKIRKD